MYKLILVLFSGLCLSAMPAIAQTTTQATPQRPSFTSNTLITQAGTMEMETGFQTAGPKTLPTWFKYTPDFGVMNGKVELTLGFDGFVHDAQTSFGTSLNLFARAPVGNIGRVSVAVSPFVSIPIQTVNGPGSIGNIVLFTFPIGKFSMDVNSTYAKLTNFAPTDNHYGNVSTTIGHPINDSTSVFASAFVEVGSNRPPSHSIMQGVAIQVTPTLVLDLAIGQIDYTGEKHFMLTTGAVINFGYVRKWVR